jgi:hypothetical protein
VIEKLEQPKERDFDQLDSFTSSSFRTQPSYLIDLAAEYFEFKLVLMFKEQLLF